MLKVDSCLCLTLETGGLIIGWLYFVIYILGAIISTIFLILICVFSCIDFKEHLGQDGVDVCNAFHGLIIGLFVVIILLCIGFAFIAWRCIQGAKTRNHAKVRPMMILLGILTVLSVLQIFNLTTATILKGLFEAAINAYFFVVIYSLYELFRLEFENGTNRHNLQYHIAGKV